MTALEANKEYGEERGFVGIQSDSRENEIAMDLTEKTPQRNTNISFYRKKHIGLKFKPKIPYELPCYRGNA